MSRLQVEYPADLKLWLRVATPAETSIASYDCRVHCCFSFSNWCPSNKMYWMYSIHSRFLPHPAWPQSIPSVKARSMTAKFKTLRAKANEENYEKMIWLLWKAHFNSSRWATAGAFHRRSSCKSFFKEAVVMTAIAKTVGFGQHCQWENVYGAVSIRCTCGKINYIDRYIYIYDINTFYYI